jgi:hypothetical protein
MSLLKRAGDLFYTFRFLKLLVTKFEDTDAFKLGIIDKDGKRIKDVDINSSERADAYTAFHKLVFNIKKLLNKVPGGSTTIGTYAAALYLLKERYGVSDSNIQKSLREVGLDPIDFMVEQSQWFVLSDGRLSPGNYKLQHDKVVNSTMEDVVKSKDCIHVSESCYPIGSMFGLNIYEAIHIKTNQKVYVTTTELLR